MSRRYLFDSSTTTIEFQITNPSFTFVGTLKENQEKIHKAIKYNEDYGQTESTKKVERFNIYFQSETTSLI